MRETLFLFPTIIGKYSTYLNDSVVTSVVVKIHPHAVIKFASACLFTTYVLYLILVDIGMDNLPTHVNFAVWLRCGECNMVANSRRYRRGILYSWAYQEI